MICTGVTMPSPHAEGVQEIDRYPTYRPTLVPPSQWQKAVDTDAIDTVFFNCTRMELRSGQFALYKFEHRRINEFLDDLKNPMNGDNIKDTRDGDHRVPRDEIRGRRLSKAHPFPWFDELVVF
jgi:hypothetical protein